MYTYSPCLKKHEYEIECIGIIHSPLPVSCSVFEKTLSGLLANIHRNSKDFTANPKAVPQCEPRVTWLTTKSPNPPALGLSATKAA